MSLTKYQFFMFPILCILACSKEDLSHGNYPSGIKSVDPTSENDCSLPECSSDRIVRLKAKNVKGTVYKSNTSGQYVISYNFTFDSYITFHVCNLPEDFKVDALDVEFDGELLDPCGIYYAVWPEEETYILKLGSIKKQ